MKLYTSTILLTLSVLSASAAAINWPALSVKSSNTISDTITGCTGFKSSDTQSFKNNGFTQFTCPFGILVAGTKDFDKNYLLYAANVISQLLDRNGDGVADSTDLVNKLANKKVIAVGGSTKSSEDVQIPGVFYAFGLQSWKAFAEGNTPTASYVQGIITEEIFHMVHQYGYALTWPSVFGTSDFTSTLCKNMAKLQCVKPGWHHSENTCPSGTVTAGNAPSSPLQGTCAEANCDCVEFYHQARFITVGQKPGWYSDNMPRDAAGMNAILDSDLKAAMADEKYAQMKKPLTNDYTAAAQPVASSGSSSSSSSASPSNLFRMSRNLAILMLGALIGFRQ